MARFHKLAVTHVQKTTKDAVVVTLKPSDDAAFEFIQGQYLTFRRDFDGTELRRSYSICAGRSEGVLKIGIKQVEGGAFSTWANNELKPGDQLESMEPAGNFHTPIEPQQAKRYLAFAGGSGITPVLSILKTVLLEEPLSSFTLVYANRGINSIMFREELEDLKNLYMSRLSIVHILESDAQDIDLFTGRVDTEKCKALFSSWINIDSIDTVFICGPEPMMLTIAASLKDHGLTEDQIKFELFAGTQTGRLKHQAAGISTAAKEQSTHVSVSMDGSQRSFTMNRATSLLEALLENAVDAPFACKAGVCSTCRCNVVEGEVEMAANHALEDYEVERGYVLACQSYPVSDRLIIDYDR